MPFFIIIACNPSIILLYTVVIITYPLSVLTKTSKTKMQALVRPYFNDAFGENRIKLYADEVCAVGFEANPHRTAALKELEAAYRKKGWRVKFFTETAVSYEEGEAEFYVDTGAKPKYRQPGSSLIPPANSDEKILVKKVDLAKYILNEVVPRDVGRRGKGALPPKVLMKVDIEGHEYALLPHLILTGALCKIDVAFYEHHPWGLLYPIPEEAYVENGVLIEKTRDIQFLQYFLDYIESMDNKTCPLKLYDLDDETYDTTIRPLPK